MELHQIRYFLALCEELHFTRAAERCAVAQSSLTRAIKALESELGGELFHRERANTHLTRLGERVKPFLEQAHTQVEAARHTAQEVARQQGSSLRLGLMQTLGPAQPVALIAALRLHHPEIVLHVSQENRVALREQLLSGAIDAAIGTVPDPDDRLDHLALYREPFVVVVNAGHPLARRAVVDLRDLAGEPYLARHYRAGQDRVPDLAPAFQGERRDWLLAMAAAGLGYALMPADSAAWPGTVALGLTQPIAREIALVTSRERPPFPALDALLHSAQGLRSVTPAPALAPVATGDALQNAAPTRDSPALSN
jgi:DNA-binding transcriptional LysR family regulator